MKDIAGTRIADMKEVVRHNRLLVNDERDSSLCPAVGQVPVLHDQNLGAAFRVGNQIGGQNWLNSHTKQLYYKGYDHTYDYSMHHSRVCETNKPTVPRYSSLPWIRELYHNPHSWPEFTILQTVGTGGSISSGSDTGDLRKHKERHQKGIITTDYSA